MTFPCSIGNHVWSFTDWQWHTWNTRVHKLSVSYFTVLSIPDRLINNCVINNYTNVPLEGRTRPFLRPEQTFSHLVVADSGARVRLHQHSPIRSHRPAISAASSGESSGFPSRKCRSLALTARKLKAWRHLILVPDRILSSLHERQLLAEDQCHGKDESHDHHSGTSHVLADSLTTNVENFVSCVWDNWICSSYWSEKYVKETCFIYSEERIRI